MNAAPLRVSHGELRATASRLGAQISADHADGVVLVGILKGSLCFLSDVLRAVSVPCVVDLLALSSYAAGGSRVRILKDLDVDVTGRDVVVVVDIVDTGLSARYVAQLLGQRKARRVEICALLHRPARRIIPVEIDYLGLEVGEEFLVGYGLDYKERYRNLSGLYGVVPAELETDPRTFERAAYPVIPAYRTGSVRE